MKTCCNETVKPSKKTVEGKTTFYLTCEKCGKIGSGASPAEAEDNFDGLLGQGQGNAIAPNAGRSGNVLAPALAPKSPALLPDYMKSHALELSNLSAPFVRTDKPAFALMVQKNTRYVMKQSGKAWDKVWSTKEGQESIIEAMEEAFMLGATLPDMGCLVPFGSVVEFIPGVEAYTFAATTGKSSPFETLNIEPIYKNDLTEASRENGNFVIHFKKIGVPRGEIIAIAVYGILKATGKQVGEIYEAARLLEKAKSHSASYKGYLADLAAFEAAKTEGKLKEKDGRPCIIKHVEYVKDGQTKSFDKETFIEDITNPYDGADRPEMLRKVAGKSFLAPYMKTRNSTAAINELSEEDDVSALLANALDDAMDTVPGNVAELARDAGGNAE